MDVHADITPGFQGTGCEVRPGASSVPLEVSIVDARASSCIASIICLEIAPGQLVRLDLRLYDRIAGLRREGALNVR